MQTFTKLLSVRSNLLCEKTSPVLYATECHFWERLWNKAGRERWSSAAKKPQHYLQNRRGWSCDSNLSSHSALVIPNKSSGFLCLWTQARGQHWHCAGAGTPSLAYTLLQQNTSSKGTFIGVSVSVGLCFWEDQNHKSLFSKASRYPLKPINHVRTGWALHTYSHAVLGNETVPNKGLWTHIFWLQEETNLSLKLFCSCLCQVSLFIISGTAPSVKVSKRWQPNGDILLRVHL